MNNKSAVLVGLLLSSLISASELRLTVDQAVSLTHYPTEDENYYIYRTYFWVGTNFTGAGHESIFGFDLSTITLDIEEVESVTFMAQAVLRHGNGGNVNLAVGTDNEWDEKTATYSSIGGSYQNISDENELNYENLHEYVAWSVNLNDFSKSLDSNYLTLFLFTNSVGEDGTNFHDIASKNYSLDAEPYLLIKTFGESESESESESELASDYQPTSGHSGTVGFKAILLCLLILFVANVNSGLVHRLRRKIKYHD